MRFGPLVIEFDDQVLRPRPWTTAQARWAAELADTAPAGRLLELCSGVGQIGLLSALLCADRGRARDIVLVDAEPRACRFARANAEQAGLSSAVEIRESSLQDALQPGELFAVIVADPPWVSSADTSGYPDDPLWAIDGGVDGLDVARSCLQSIDQHLQPGGSAVLQLGTEEQIDILAAELDDGLDDGLEVVERRQLRGANGVLVRLVPRR
jgi:release factor glutamine methyltransferase